MKTIGQYAAPHTLHEAISAVADKEATALAGGTDLLPRWSRGLASPPGTLVDLKRVADLRGVSRTNGGIRIGACTTMSDLAADPTIRAAAPVLADAAGRIACPQVRNRATIGGNLCNASPAADTAIPLILLDAVLELASAGADGLTTREVPIADFFRGPGATALAAGEILTRVRFQPLPAETLAAWDKFGTRPAMEIAVASVGVAVRFAEGKITHARVGYGSVAPVPLRGRRAEAELLGKPLSEQTIESCVAAARAEINPITDVRASAAYRREVGGVMLRRMLQRAGCD
jgi:CO/xanthine dehydrogenase FAD-binding subunit